MAIEEKEKLGESSEKLYFRNVSQGIAALTRLITEVMTHAMTGKVVGRH